MENQFKLKYRNIQSLGPNKEDDPEIVYYNASIINPNSNNNNIYAPYVASVDAIVSAQNNIPILQNPDNFYCSIFRCEIPTRNIPIVQILIQAPIPNVGAVNNTIYSFTFEYVNNTTGAVLFTSPQTFMIYEPRNNYQIPNYTYPAPAQLYTPYYYCYQVQQVCDMMNVAMSTAFTSLQTLAAPALAAATAPFINYDANTQLLSIYSPETYYDQTLAGDIIKVYINKVTEELFSGFPKITNPLGSGQPNGNDLCLIMKSYNGLNIVSGVMQTIMNYSNYGYWSWLQRIYIGTNMNVNSEIYFQQQTIQQQQNNQLIGGTGQNQVFVNVLYDFLPDLSQLAGELGASSKIQLFNAPTNLYKPFTFNQKTPLYEISLSVWMVDRYGNALPMPLSVNESCNFKLQFIRKDLVKF